MQAPHSKPQFVEVKAKAFDPKIMSGLTPEKYAANVLAETRIANASGDLLHALMTMLQTSPSANESHESLMNTVLTGTDEEAQHAAAIIKGRDAIRAAIDVKAMAALADAMQAEAEPEAA